MTEWNAPGYARIAALQEAMAAEVLALLNLTGSERVLDLGCGNGKVTAEIAARVPDGSVMGVDASSEMISFAASHYPPSDHPNLHFEASDIRRIRFHGEFDLVVSFNALHWIPDQGEALRAIQLAMKPEALAQLRLVSDGERKSLETVIEETRKSERWTAYFRDFHDPYLHLTPKRYAALAEESGLHVDEMKVGDKAWDFKSHAGFAAFGSVTFVEWSRHIPESERPSFVEDVLERYRREVCKHAEEQNVFRFYQMDITLTR
jgi:trans-aconitate 2-methyltransferase